MDLDPGSWGGLELGLKIGPVKTSNVKRNLRSVPFQRLKLANFGVFAGDMDMDRCWKVISIFYTDIVTFPMSTEAGVRLGGGGEGPGPPWDLKKHYIFKVSSAKLRDLHL